MNTSFRTFSLAAALLMVATASAVDVFGVTVNSTGLPVNLIRFNSSTPGTLSQSVAISGLANGDRLVGLDFRSNGGALYALGALGNIYTLDKNTGSVLTTLAISGATLQGTGFGFDFNPTVDRARIVSNSGQNLRVNVDTGVAIVDTNLKYAAADPFAFEQPNIVAVAYTNNQLGGPNPQSPTRTTMLFDIDSSLDNLVQQTNANGGILETRSPLGLNTTNLTDMDIYTGPGGGNTAFAVMNQPGLGSSFYTLTLGTSLSATPSANFVGSFQDRVSLIAAQPVPEPASMAALALGALAVLRRRRNAK